ncbi:MAG: hypothetical protein ABIQ95_00615 [Bdellovibrionia bacterium]
MKYLSMITLLFICSSVSFAADTELLERMKKLELKVADLEKQGPNRNWVCSGNCIDKSPYGDERWQVLAEASTPGKAFKDISDQCFRESKYAALLGTNGLLGTIGNCCSTY